MSARRVVLLLCVMLLSAPASPSRAADAEPNPLPSERRQAPPLQRAPTPAEPVGQASTTPAVPGGQTSTTPGPSPAVVTELSLQQALQFALKSNTTLLVARERQVESRAQETQSRAPLMPNLSLNATQSNQQINLASLGFKPGIFPGLSSTVVGPFDSFDSRLALVQNVYNLASILRARLGRAGVLLAQLQERLTQQQVAATVEMAYVAALRNRRAVEDAQANVELATSLLRQAQHQRDAGVATGLDVTRADTRLAQNQVRLAQAQYAAYQALLQLQHIAGLPLGNNLVLTDALHFTVEPLPEVAAAVAQSLQQRAEMQVSKQQIVQNDLDLRAALADHDPTMDVAADYGLAGVTPGPTDLAVHNVALRLKVPLYDGGLTNGRVAAARSRKRQSELQYHDVGVQVEQDVRQAVTALQTAAGQVEAANRNLDLAQRELKMSVDRFGAGLGDNVEVITAQTALADARDSQAAALTQYHTARINLASALGTADTFRW